MLRNSIPEVRNKYAVLAEVFSSIWIDGKTTGKVHALFLRKTSIGTAPDEKGPKITVMN